MPSRVRSVDVEFIPESGCPVDVTNGRTELDLDAFDAPLAARIYIDYRNNSDRPVSAVKFRIRFVDASGKDRGTMHAPHMAVLGPGATATEKWKYEKVHPGITGLKVRVLQVRYQDGSGWQSAKMSELANPAQGGGNAGGGIIPGAPQQGGGGGLIPTFPQEQQQPPQQAQGERATQGQLPDNAQPQPQVMPDPLDSN